MVQGIKVFRQVQCYRTVSYTHLLAFLSVNIIPAVSFIGVTTFILSVAGVKAGNLFGMKYKSKAERAGGIILILMAANILIEHLFF